MKAIVRTCFFVLFAFFATVVWAGGTTESTQTPGPKLMYWGWLNQQSNEVVKVISPAMAEFNANNSYHATIDYLPLGAQYMTKLQTEFGTNTAADLMMVSDAGAMEPFVKAGKMEALDSLVGPDVLGQYSAPLLKTVRFNGKTYALPLARTSAVVYYNTAIFAKYNLKPPKTMDDLMAIITTLKTNGVTPFALCNKVPATWQGGLFIGMLGYRLGGSQLFYDLSSGAAKFSDPLMVQAAGYFGQMVAAGAFPTDANNITVDQARQDFMTEKAGMWFMLSSEISNLTAQTQQNGVPNPVYGKVDFFNWPSLPNGKTDQDAWILSPDYGLCLSSSSPAKPAAVEFMKLLVSPKYQKLFASISDSPSINNSGFDTSQANPLFAKLLASLAHTSDSVTFPDRILGQQTIGGELNVSTQPLISGDKPATVMTNLEARAAELRKLQ